MTNPVPSVLAISLCLCYALCMQSLHYANCLSFADNYIAWCYAKLFTSFKNNLLSHYASLAWFLSRICYQTTLHRSCSIFAVSLCMQTLHI